MKKLQWPIIIILFIVPAFLIIYKVIFLNQALLPVSRDDLWKLEVNIDASQLVGDNVLFPIPTNTDVIKIRDLKVIKTNKKFRKQKNDDGQLLIWDHSDAVAKIGYTSVVKFQSKQELSSQQQKKKVYKASELEHFKTLPPLSAEVTEALDNLQAAILSNLDNKKEIVRKIYDYMEQEIQLKTTVRSIEDALISGKASRLVQAKLFNLLVRRVGIPARIVVGVVLDEEEASNKSILRLSYVNQVFLDKRWMTISPMKKIFDQAVSHFVPLYLNYDEISDFMENEDLVFKIYASKVKVTKFDTAGYGKQISKSNSFVNMFNLYQLPLALQNLFYSILLIPVGALVLSIARNFIGITTFGIFTPILLTLFFMETGPVLGFIFFTIMVGLGLIERLILDKFYLLAVPRLSIIMTLMILMMMFFALFIHTYFPAYVFTMTVFPIVIMTVIIERFSITLIESGARNTLKTLIGTLIISYLCYALFSINKLQILLFTYPELQLIVIALLIMIGDYKGYRLSELIRFKQFRGKN
jgi:hypothetical protein